MPGPLIYVAGPFRGATAWQRERNIREAEVAAMSIALCGGVPVVPHSMYRHFDGEVTDGYWLAATLELLRRCDGVALLHLWRNSAGATAEREEALRLGLPVIEIVALDDLALVDWIAGVAELCAR